MPGAGHHNAFSLADPSAVHHGYHLILDQRDSVPGLHGRLNDPDARHQLLYISLIKNRPQVDLVEDGDGLFRIDQLHDLPVLLFQRPAGIQNENDQIRLVKGGL